ncbi:MAG: nucleotidyltransferase domain-containing protein [Bryobacterales bacterium]|nr:nucleotidyltransferase domain-containing protein [Bryobacterales bacterium]
MTKEAAIREIASRLVSHFDPLRIYLFGSQARGDSGPESDLDFLVVVPDETPREKLKAGPFFVHAKGVPFPIDVVVWKVSEFDRRLHLRASFPATVVREGRLLYAAADLVER